MLDILVAAEVVDLVSVYRLANLRFKVSSRRAQIKIHVHSLPQTEYNNVSDTN